MPAQSPTLSPTLSAITAGLRGSSSGMPASTLPTRSAPTSAPLVKMPPPRRAKIEISEPPKARPTSGWITCARLDLIDRVGVEQRVVARDAEQAEPHHQHPGDRAAAEGDLQRLVQADARRFRGAHVRAHRDVHADDAAGAGEHRADEEAPRRCPVERNESDHEEKDHADDARWSCTGATGRRSRLRAPRPRSRACARCRRAGAGCACSARRRRRSRVPRRRARR